ncbi:MAG: AMP-binding protein [Polyangiaceae bacterium]
MAEPLDTVSLLEDRRVRFGARPLFGEKRGGAFQFLTYAEFARGVDAARSFLASLGIGAGDRVAIIAANRVEWATLSFAVHGVGAAFVPMYEAQLEDDWVYILRDSRARLCFAANAGIASRVRARSAELPMLDRVIALDATPEDEGASFAALVAAHVAGGVSPRPARRPDRSDVATIVYTSGTTGRPKGVLLSHENLAAQVAGILAAVPLGPESRLLSFLPWAHVGGGVCELMGIVSIGASTALAEGPDKILQNLAEVRPSALVAVPRIWNRLRDAVERQIEAAPAPVRRLFRAAMRARAKARRGESPTMRERVALALAERLILKKVRARLGGRLEFALSGAAALSLEVAEYIDDLGIVVLEGWGMTELSGLATINRLGERRLGSVGKPIDGVRVRIDRSVGDASDGESGEVVTYGPIVMRGYEGEGQGTGVVIDPDGGLRTGDLGRIDPDGFLFITGRVKERFKLENGKYVAPVAIEERVALSRFVAQAYVHGDNRPHTVALVVPDWTSLRELVRARFPHLTSDDDIVADAAVRAAVHADIEAQLGAVRSYERPKAIAILREEFTTDNGLLTPTLKMKRNAVFERHREIVFGLYR